MTPREQASEICERHSINDDSPMAMEIAAAIEKAGRVTDGCVKLPDGKIVKDSEYRPPVRGGDGKEITVRSRQWFVDDLEPPSSRLQWAEVRSVSPDEVHFRPLQRVLWLVPELCYSTREAAQAAAAKGGGDGDC